VVSLRQCLALLVCTTAVAGCSRWSYDIGSDLVAAEIPAVEDQLNVRDVLARMGPPLRISALPGGYVLAYEYWHIVQDKVGIGISAAGVNALSIDWGNARIQGEFLLLGFNREHQLVDSTFQEWDRDTGGGKSIQPLQGLVSVVGVGDLTHPMPQHRWGAFYLEEIAVALNAQSNLDIGQNGLEQRGTPVDIGQRSLEKP